jgi:hypothetical protein
MTTYTLIEPLLVGLIIATSAFFSLRRVAPRLLGHLGGYARKAGLPESLVAWLMPPDKNCESSCGQCCNCGAAPKSSPVTLHRRKSG